MLSRSQYSNLIALYSNQMAHDCSTLTAVHSSKERAVDSY
jgi:hypothetical protein